MTRTLARTAILLTGLVSAPAFGQGCDPAYAVAFRASDESKLTIAVNDAPIFRELTGGGPGGAAPPTFLVNGENTLSATLDPNDTESASAEVELFRACEGTFPKAVGSNDNVLASLSLSGEETKETTFIAEGQPAYAWMTAEPTGDDGLLEAVGRLIAAARAEDIEAYMAFLGPMTADFTKQGMPKGTLAGNAAQIFADMDVVDTGTLETRPILGGRVWEVTDGAYKAPLQFAPGGDVTSGEILGQATYWIRTDDGWRVVRH